MRQGSCRLCKASSRFTLGRPSSPEKKKPKKECCPAIPPQWENRRDTIRRDQRDLGKKSAQVSAVAAFPRGVLPGWSRGFSRLKPRLQPDKTPAAAHVSARQRQGTCKPPTCSFMVKADRPDQPRR